VPGKEAKLSFIGHALMENRSGLIVAATVTKATGTAERKAAEEMIVRHSPGVRRITVGGDKGYDAASFVADMRALNVTPHIAQNTSGRRSALDARTTRHPGYEASQRCVRRSEHQLSALSHLLVSNLVQHRFQITNGVSFDRRQCPNKLDMLEEHNECVADPTELFPVAGDGQRVLLDGRIGRFPEIDRDLICPWERLRDRAREREIEICHAGLLRLPTVGISIRAARPAGHCKTLARNDSHSGLPLIFAIKLIVCIVFAPS
jgi:hypothetical protein